MGKKIIEAISRVQAMRDEAAKASDEYEKEGLDADGSWKSWEAESIGSAHEGGIDALDRVLDVLQSLAHGITPAQGEPEKDEPELDEDAQEALDKRVEVGRDCIARAYGSETSWDELHEEDRETYATDAISDVLTAIYGPAGRCLPPTGIFDNVSDVIADARGEQVWRVEYDEERGSEARELLRRALQSWLGDAEDYTVEVEEG